MQKIGDYWDRQIYWLDFENFNNGLPEKNWLCLAIANIEPDFGKTEMFFRKAIKNKILEFKGHGKYGEKLHDFFDEVIVNMQVLENFRDTEVMTTWHNDELLIDTFWQCFFASSLPNNAYENDVIVVCTDFDGTDRQLELKSYLKKFELGWLP